MINYQTLHKKQFGFSIVELMIVVAIIGILASIGLPRYQEYVARSIGREAEAQMLEILVLQERYFINNQAYTTSVTDLGLTAKSGAPASMELTDSGQVTYTLTIGACVPASAGCTRVTATPNGQQQIYGALSAQSNGIRMRTAKATVVDNSNHVSW